MKSRKEFSEYRIISRSNIDILNKESNKAGTIIHVISSRTKEVKIKSGISIESGLILRLETVMRIIEK